MLDLQQARDERVAAGLLDYSVSGVDQDDGQIRRRGACHHVARVLNVPRRVCDDELALGRGEVAIGHIDRDALLPLRTQAVGQQRQIHVFVTALLARLLHRLPLIFKNGFAVVQ